MHQIAPNCSSSFKIFPGVNPHYPHTGEGDTPSPDLSPTSRLDSWPPATRSPSPSESSILPP